LEQEKDEFAPPSIVAVSADRARDNRDNRRWLFFPLGQPATGNLTSTACKKHTNLGSFTTHFYWLRRRIFSVLQHIFIFHDFCPMPHYWLWRSMT